MAKAQHLKDAFMHFEKYGNFDNCYANEDALRLLKKANSVVSRYMPYSRLKKAASESKLTFLSPEKWIDPFEKIYLHTKLYGLLENVIYEPPPIVCLCLTKQQFRNSVAFWKCFKTDMNQQLVRVEFYLKKFVEQICSLQKDVNIYVSSINYKLDADTIKGGRAFIQKITGSVDEHTNLEELYVKTLSYKRKSFEYEREIRVFIIPQNKKDLNIDENGVVCLANFDYNATIKKIWLEPHPPGWVLLNKAREELNFLASKISKSNLYKQQEPCKKICLEDQVLVVIINWDMTEEMNEDNASQYIAEAFNEYQKNPIVWNRHPKYFHHLDERNKQRELKSRIATVNRIWKVEYNSDASIPLDGLDSDYYEIKRNSNGSLNLIKSKEKNPSSVLCLDSGKLPSSVQEDAITFVFLKDLIGE